MKKLIAFVVVSMPLMVLAQTTGVITDVNSLSQKLTNLLNLATYLLMALAFVFIVWNVVMYMIRSQSEDDRKKAGWSILYGIVGLFIIVSIWGLVNILSGTFKTNTTPGTIPKYIPASDIPRVP